MLDHKSEIKEGTHRTFYQENEVSRKSVMTGIGEFHDGGKTRLQLQDTFSLVNNRGPDSERETRERDTGP